MLRQVFITFFMLLLPGLLHTASPQSCAERPTASQTPGTIIKAGEDRPVEIGASNLAAVEPYLAANPKDANHLVAGVILVAKMGDPRRPVAGSDQHICAALTSFDAGKTWARHDFPLKECIDPWAEVLPDGSAVFLALGIGPSGRFEMLSFRSPDGGRTWDDKPVSFGSGHDHGTLAVDRSKGQFAGSLYVASHQSQPGSPRRDATFVARSSDGGASFQQPARVISSNLSTFALNPVVLSDGLLVVPFINFTQKRQGGGYAFFDRAPSWVITSADGGKTFSAPMFVTDFCTRGWSELAVDASNGPNRDRLYYTCHDSEARKLYVTTSADRGETWSEPVVVNRGSGRSPYVQNAVIAVNREGVVGVSWYDARNDPRGYRGTFRCQDVYFSASLDGGKTFLPEVKISSAENCPDTPQNGEAGRRWVAGGDYYGLAATADGSFRLLWADSRTGIYQLRTAGIVIDSKAGN